MFASNTLRRLPWTRFLLASSLGLASAYEVHRWSLPNQELFCDPLHIEEDVHIANWSNNHEAFVPQFSSPETVDELRQIIRFAGSHDYKIKVCGKGLSPNGAGFRLATSMAPETALEADGRREVLLSCENMNRILHFDEATSELHVESGITVREILDFLKERGLTLENFSSIQEQQVGGWTQMACHGTGISLATVEEQISELRLIDGTGTERILSPTNNPDLFKVAKAGLGGLGVLTSMKLKCTPRHRLLENTFVLNHKDMTPKYHHDLLKVFRHVRYMWLPNTDKVVVVISNPVGDDEEVDIPPSSATINPLAQLLSDLQGSKLTTKVEELSKLSFAELRDRLIAVAPLDPEHIAAVNNAEASYWETLGLGSGTRCEDSIDVLGFDCGGEQHVLEVCFPMGSAWRKDHRQAQDVDAVKKILRVIEEQKLPAASPIEQRWTSSSTSTMSPASSDNREDTFTWIGIIQYIPADADETLKNEVKQAFERYVEAIEPILEEYKAVPHWAKIEPIQGEGERKQKQKEAIAARYNLKEFREAKKELDPNNLFSLGIYESVLN